MLSLVLCTYLLRNTSLGQQMLPTGRSNLWFMILLDAMECYGHEDYILSGSYYPVQESLYLLSAVDIQFQSNPVQIGPSMALCNTPEAVYLLERS